MSSLLRYFLKAWALPFLWALLFYGGIVMTYEVITITNEVITVGAPPYWSAALLLLSLPEVIELVLPMAAVLGGFMGTYNLSENYELVAAQGLGIGKNILIKPWAVLSTVLLIMTTINAHILIPKAKITQRTVQARMFEDARTRFLRPGAPPHPLSGKPQSSVWVAPSGHIHLMEVNNDHVQHLIADSLKLRQGGNNFEHFDINIEMKNIKCILLNKADSKVTLIQQEDQTHTFKIPPTPKLFRSTNTKIETTPNLLRNINPESIIELSQRFNLPLTTCAMLLLGIALGLGHPRFNKGGAITKSVGVIVTYYVIIKLLENQVLLSKSKLLFPCFLIFTLPFIFLIIGFIVLKNKLKPHHQNRFSYLVILQKVRCWLQKACKAFLVNNFVSTTLKQLTIFSKKVIIKKYLWRYSKSATNHTLETWTNNLWWRSWGSVIGTFLALSFFINYASLSRKLTHNNLSMLVFIRYWLWNLPTFITTILPLAFLLGWILILSNVTMSNEWIALRAGGISFLQWCKAGIKSWGTVLLFTFIIQVFLAPFALKKAMPLYRWITRRPTYSLKVESPWLNLGSTGVYWFLDGDVRWGFPLKQIDGNTPAMLKWVMHAPSSQALLWDTFNFIPGPHAFDLFPDKALQDSASAEETPTLDLFRWQKWAPNAENGTLLWSRLLNFLSGPCVFFGVYPFLAPSSRKGRNHMFGYSLLGGLVFMGLQVVFIGAAKLGNFPPIWGILCPMLLYIGFGLVNLHKLRN